MPALAGGSRSIAAAICLVAGLAIGVACLIAPGPLPGDVSFTRGQQSIFGEAPAWATLLTATAKPPGIWLTLAAATGLAYARGLRWSVAAPSLALLGVTLLDALLRALIFAPKPTAALVAVAAPSTSSGLPSTFALVYGALFGAVLFAPGRRGALPVLASVSSALLVVAGCCARLVLGGHWTSQLLASLLLSFALVSALHGLLSRAGGR
jgi:membrane-associated phospholipid phosphatase